MRFYESKPGIGRLCLLALCLVAGACQLWPKTAAADDPPVTPAAPAFQLFLPLASHQQRPPSFTLIEEAEARGELDAETALTYAVFATFGDPRLPEAFRGDDSGVIDSDAVAEATQRFAELSPATRETLVPFLIPPVYAGSWYDLRINGATASAHIHAPLDLIDDRCNELAQGLLIPFETANFVVWYPPFDNKMAERAFKISANLETRIHPILTGLFREPLGDSGLGCNPGDGRLDVYMVFDPIPGEANTLALVSTYPGGDCKATPTYMLVLKESRSELDTIAHEFMHMIQFAYNPAAGCYDDWWFEATAEWAIDYFETVDDAPDDQDEHRSAIAYLETAWRWLLDPTDLREYGAYLWPFYLSHYTGTYHPELIAEIFAASEDAANGDLYQIIDARIDGGWATRWPEFALLNLNLPPHTDYQQWDRFAYRWRLHWRMGTGGVALQDDPYWVYYVNGRTAGDPITLPDLGIYYEEISIDKDVQLWAFANTFANVPHMRVQALLYRAGQGWQGPEDWSQQPWSIFCHDDPAGRVEHLLLIISNSDWVRRTGRTAPTGDLRMVTSDLPCAGWQGSSHWELTGGSSDADSTVSYTIRGDATPRFTLKQRTVVSDVLTLEYQTTGGDASWSTHVESTNLETGQVATCDRSGGSALTAANGTLLVVENMAGDAMDRKFFGGGLVPSPTRCPGLDSWSHVPWLVTDLRDTGLRPWPNPATQGRLSGDDTLTQTGDSSSSTTTSAWNFAAR